MTTLAAGETCEGEARTDSAWLEQKFQELEVELYEEQRRSSEFKQKMERVLLDWTSRALKAEQSLDLVLVELGSLKIRYAEMSLYKKAE